MSPPPGRAPPASPPHWPPPPSAPSNGGSHLPAPPLSHWPGRRRDLHAARRLAAGARLGDSPCAQPGSRFAGSLTVTAAPARSARPAPGTAPGPLRHRLPHRRRRAPSARGAFGQRGSATPRKALARPPAWRARSLPLPSLRSCREVLVPARLLLRLGRGHLSSRPGLLGEAPAYASGKVLGSVLKASRRGMSPPVARERLFRFLHAPASANFQISSSEALNFFRKKRAFSKIFPSVMLCSTSKK